MNYLSLNSKISIFNTFQSRVFAVVSIITIIISIIIIP